MKTYLNEITQCALSIYITHVLVENVQFVLKCKDIYFLCIVMNVIECVGDEFTIKLN